MKWLLPSCIVLLSLISLITLRSVAPQLVGLQTTFVILGLGTFLASWKMGFDRFLTFRWPLYVGLLVLLIIIFLFAEVTRGSTSWLAVGGINIQGSQLAGPIIALVIAQYVAKNGLRTLEALVGLAGIISLPIGLIIIAPDLGTAIIVLSSIAGVILSSSIKNEFIIGGVLAVGAIALFSWLFVLAPYQKDRITSFINPSGDTQDSGYNARQALIAVGSGQLVGRGLGQGIQSQLRFLPERQTDFIFASLAEEWGFVGAGLVLVLYMLFIGSILFKLWKLPNSPQYFFMIATLFFFTTQILVNIGMNMQLVPITGITLPFVSYGGSSFIAFCLHCGIAQSIITQKETIRSYHLA